MHQHGERVRISTDVSAGDAKSVDPRSLDWGRNLSFAKRAALHLRFIRQRDRSYGRIELMGSARPHFLTNTAIFIVETLM